MISQSRKRLFIALAYDPGEQVAALLKELREMAAGQITGLRPVAPENLHVTLRFLGMVPESDIGLISQVTEQVCRGSECFRLKLTGIGSFRQAIWLGVESDQRLNGMVERLNAGLSIIGLPADEKAYVPHLTVARLRGPSEAVTARLQQRFGDRDWGGLPVRAVNLYESTTLPEGARYRVLYSVQLET